MTIEGSAELMHMYKLTRAVSAYLHINYEVNMAMVTSEASDRSESLPERMLKKYPS